MRLYHPYKERTVFSYHDQKIIEMSQHSNVTYDVYYVSRSRIQYSGKC